MQTTQEQTSARTLPVPVSVPASQKPDFLPSATTGWAGVAGFMVAVLAMNELAPAFPWRVQGLLVMAFTAAPMLAYDAWVLRREAAGAPVDGMTRQHAYSAGRTAVKLVGLLATVTLLALLYWVFPEYYESFAPGSTSRYAPFFALCRAALPWAAPVAVAYFYLVDARMRDPHDGYWHFGRMVLLRLEGTDRAKVANHLRTWAVKGFFLPLMFTYLCGNLSGLRTSGFTSFQAAFQYLHNLFFTIDLAFVCCGYLLTLRLVQSHVRSAEPTALGWTAALVCYIPFWGLVGSSYLGYWSDTSWNGWLSAGTPLYYAWGVAILLFEAVFVWATIVFGLRFSNLTHRGIIRSGPYHFTRHPAYVSKLCAFFLISVPMIDTRGAGQGIRNCLMLAGLGLVYWLRAKTEERHLASIDPAYAIYSAEVAERHRRWFAPLARPFRRVRPSAAG